MLLILAATAVLSSNQTCLIVAGRHMQTLAVAMPHVSYPKEQRHGVLAPTVVRSQIAMSLGNRLARRGFADHQIVVTTEEVVMDDASAAASLAGEASADAILVSRYVLTIQEHNELAEQPKAIKGMCLLASCFAGGLPGAAVAAAEASRPTGPPARLDVMLVERSSGKVLWRGSAGGATPYASESTVAEIVAWSLETLPLPHTH